MDEIKQLISHCEEVWLEGEGSYSDVAKVERHDGMMLDLAACVGALKAYHMLIKCAPIKMQSETEDD